MINREFVIKTLSNVLGFKHTYIDRIGDVIEMSARDAFLYSTLTAHGYLNIDEPEYRYFLKRDYYRIFNQAEEYNLQEGLFSISDLSFSCTPKINIKENPIIASGMKYILPIEYKQYSELLDTLKAIIQVAEKMEIGHKNFIIVPIRNNSTKVSEFEAFFEFIISKYFAKFGFFSDTQIPFYYGVGTPDVAIYKIDELYKSLQNNGIGFQGYSLIELMTITTFGLNQSKDNLSLYKWDNAVFEVKTLQSSAPQINKYISKMIFQKAYEVIPFKKKSSNYAGLITFSSSGEMQIINDNSDQKVNLYQQAKYYEWLNTYVKFYILANLSTSQLEKLFKDKKVALSKDSIVNYLSIIDYDKLIKEVLYYGKN